MPPVSAPFPFPFFPDEGGFPLPLLPLPLLFFPFPLPPLGAEALPLLAGLLFAAGRHEGPLPGEFLSLALLAPLALAWAFAGLAFGLPFALAFGLAFGVAFCPAAADGDLPFFGATAWTKSSTLVSGLGAPSGCMGTSSTVPVPVIFLMAISTLSSSALSRSFVGSARRSFLSSFSFFSLSLASFSLAAFRSRTIFLRRHGTSCFPCRGAFRR